MRAMLLPLLLLVLCISSTEAFSPLSVPNTAHVQQSNSINDRYSLHAPPYKRRISLVRTRANDPWKQRQRNVLSIYSPILLHLATDDNSNREEQKSLFRRILTFPIRLLRKPLRFLRRKKDESGEESREEAAASEIDIAPAEEASISDDSQDAVDQAVSESPSVQVDKQSEVQPAEETEQVVVSTSTERSPTCAKSVDLSGEWDLRVTDEFKDQYDHYLTLLGQPFLVRSVAMSVVAMTTEETKQTDNGRSLFILGRNLRGVWERELVTTDKDSSTEPFVPLQREIVTADGENVVAEAWWEDEGRTHRSWLRGVKKYGGGDFESRRYLADNGDSLVCESTFHPIDPKREKANVTWRFTRQKEGDGDKQS